MFWIQKYFFLFATLKKPKMNKEEEEAFAARLIEERAHEFDTPPTSPHPATSTTPKIVTKKICIPGPKSIKRTFPSVEDTKQVEMDETKKSVIRCILDGLNKGAEPAKLLPLLPSAPPEGLEPEIFTDMSQETWDKLDATFKEDLQRRARLKETELDSDMEVDEEERPHSPGQEYDKFFIHGEIGVREPRFRAKVHAKAYEGLMNSTDLDKLVSHAEDLEKELRRNYKNFKSPQRIRKAMLRDYAKKKQQKKLNK